MKRLWDTIVYWLLSNRFKQLQEIESALTKRIDEIQTVYTTIKTFTGMNTEYYGWVTRLLDSEEYKFMMFDLRENIIRETIGSKDENDMLRNAGRLDMINVIGNYLVRYKKEYEEKVLGDSKH